jgi:hypothetical protein
MRRRTRATEREGAVKKRGKKKKQRKKHQGALETLGKAQQSNPHNAPSSFS